MGTSIFYVLLSVGIAFGLTWLLSYIRKNKIFEQEDLLRAIKLLDLNLKIVSELRLDKEEEILQISQIVIDALEYGIDYYNNPDDVIKNANDYALELCIAFGIEMTESRQQILQELIDITFNNKYTNLVEDEDK